MFQPLITVERARALRKQMSLPEVLLWRELRRAATPSVKFRRQHPLGPYILDFYCASARWCVEIDGAQHSEAGAADESRDAYLLTRGVGTLRVRAWRVLENPEYVADRLIAWAAHLSERRREQAVRAR